MAIDFELSDKQYEQISTTIYNTCRINLHDGKKDLVQARLLKRIRQLKVSGFQEYLDRVENDADEFTVMVDFLSTNLTTFFREPRHFEFLESLVLPRFRNSGGRKIRLWCAGCSSGEEPYSLAILLRQSLEPADLRDCLILATDISTRMLDMAKNGAYPEQRMANVPANIRSAYFTRTGAQAPLFKAGPELKRMIRFRRLNLAGTWPMKGRFDVIFCRNVMIYFDRQTQAELVAKFHEFLNPGGYLIVGHSESLVNVRHEFQYVQPSIYMKAPAGQGASFMK